MVEGTWRILSIGIQYSLGGNPRNDPRFKMAMEITKIIEDNLEKKYGLPVEEYLNIKGKSNREDRVIQMLQNEEKRKSERAYQRRSISDSTINVLSMMEAEYAAMLRGAQTMIEKLGKQNEILKRKIAGMERLPKQRKIGPQDTTGFSRRDDKESILDQEEWPSLE